MAYYTRFEGKTQEEALAKAKDYIKRTDIYRQPSLYGCHEQDGKWIATVKYYGLD